MKKLRFVQSALAVAILGIMPVFPALAAGPACDVEFMRTLQQKAWREAQREVMTNQTQILKPDSVFALSCFGRSLNRIPSAFTTTGSAAGNDARNAMGDYMANFAHGYLGAGSGSQNTSTCGQMMTIWSSLKCRSVDPNMFGTLSFATISSGDIRTNNPQTCGSNPTGTWSSTATRVNAVGASAPFDSANLFLNITDPLDLTNPKQCAPGIKTGVKIGASGGSTYDEIVCPNPGCIPKGNPAQCQPQ